MSCANPGPCEPIPGLEALNAANLRDAIAAAEARDVVAERPRGDGAACLTVKRARIELRDGWPGGIRPNPIYEDGYGPWYYTYTLGQCRELVRIIDAAREADREPRLYACKRGNAIYAEPCDACDPDPCPAP